MQFLALRSVRFFLSAVLFTAVPFFVFRCTVFGIPTNAFEIVLGIMTLFAFASLSVEDGARAQFIHFVVRHPVYRAWAVFALLSTVALCLFPSAVSAGIWKSWVIVPWLFCLVWQALSREISVRDIVMGLLFTSVPLLFSAYFQIAGWYPYQTIDGRVSWWLNSANSLALILLPVVVAVTVFVTQWNHWHDVRARHLSVVFLIYSALPLIGARSYNVFLILFLVLWLYALLSLRGKYLAVFAVVCTLFLSTFVVLEHGSDKSQQAFDSLHRSSTSVRLQVYEVAVTVLSREPITGYGLGTFPILYQKEAPNILWKAPFEWVMLHPHNIFLDMWWQLGIVGLLGTVLLFVWVFFQILVRKNVWALPLLALLLSGLFDRVIWKNDYAIVFLLCCFLACVAAHQSRKWLFPSLFRGE